MCFMFASYTLLHCSLALRWSSARSDLTSAQTSLVLGQREEYGGEDMKSWLSSLQPFPLLSFAASTVVIQREILETWETSQYNCYVKRSCSSQCRRQPTHCMITFRWQHKLQWINFSRSTDRTLGGWVTQRKIYTQKQAFAVKETHLFEWCRCKKNHCCWCVGVSSPNKR